MSAVRCLAAIVAGALCIAAAPSAAQMYPSKPVRVIVPFVPGGATDIVARSVLARLPEHLGQQVIFDNRGGAGTIVGTEVAARSAPDGYTLLMAVTAFAINASLHRKLPYDPARDFAPVSLLAKAPIVIVVHPSVPARNARELIALAKKTPGKLTFGSPGTGTANHLTGELFKAAAGVDILHVPYKGGTPGMTAVVGGDIDMFMGIGAALTPYLSGGRLRVVGVSSAKRSPHMPDVPTLAESGLPGFETTSFYSVVAPAGVPRPIIERLNAEVRKSAQSEEARKRLEAEGAFIETTTPEALGVFLQTEIARWAKAVAISGARPD